MANVYDDRIDLSDVMEMDFAPDDFSKYKLEYGDILLNEGQSPEWLGRPAMYRGELDGACFTNSLIRFKAGPRVDPSYALLVFRYYLYSGRFKQEARITTNIAHLSARRFAEVEFPVPPLKTQHAIVRAAQERLEQIDQAATPIAAARRLAAQFRGAVLETALSGDLTTVGDLLEGVEAGKSFRCHGYRAAPGAWGVLKVSAMTWGEFRPEENKQVLDDTNVDSRWEVHPGDLLISRANTSEYVGAAVFVRDTPPQLLLSDKSLRLLPRADLVDPEWLFFALNAPSSRRQLSAVATGTSDSMRNLSQAKIRAVSLRIPPKSEQQEVANKIRAKLRALEELLAAVASQEAKTPALRTALLRDALFARE